MAIVLPLPRHAQDKQSFLRKLEYYSCSPRPLGEGLGVRAAKSPPSQSLLHVSNKLQGNQSNVLEYHFCELDDQPQFQYHAVCFYLIQYCH